MNVLLTHKIETAFQNLYLTSSLSGSISSSFDFERPLNIYKGEDHEDKNAPCIIINVECEMEEVVLFSGVFRVAAKIDVKEMAVDVDDPDISTLAQTVFEIALDPDLNLISYDTHGGLGIMQMYIMQAPTVRAEGDAWVTSMTLGLISTSG